jgi:hypothetical protein
MLVASATFAEVVGGCGRGRGHLGGSRWLDLAGGVTTGLQETLKGDQQRSTGKGGLNLFFFLHTQHVLHVVVVGRPDTPTKAATGNRP